MCTLRILHAFDIFNIPKGGGTVDIIYCLTREQAKRGHEVILCAGDYGADSQLLRSSGAKRYTSFRSYYNKHGVHLMPGIMSLDVRSIDIIHLHCFRSFQNAVLCGKAKRHGIPFVVDAHGSTVRSSSRKQILHRLYDRVWGQNGMRNAAALIAETEVGRQEFLSLGAAYSKIRIVHPGLDISEFDSLPEKGLFRKKHNISDDEFIVLFLGRLHEDKGISFLLNAVNRLLQLDKGVTIVLVGQNDGYEFPDSKIPVVTTGFLSGVDKLAALVDADVLVQPSKYEAGARPSLEALLCGTPVIVTRGTGAGTVVESFHGGYLVPYNSTFWLKRVLEHIRNREQGAEVVERTRLAGEWVRNNMGFDKKVLEYEAVYEEAIA